MRWIGPPIQMWDRADAVKRGSFMDATALLLVLVFVCVPALSRLHDHLSASDQPTFRFSKNIERPHEKQTPPRLVATDTASAVDESVSWECIAALGTPSARSSLLVAFSPLRAPPAR